MPFDLGPVPDVACVELPFKVSAGYATAGSMPSEALETLGGVAVVGSAAASETPTLALRFRPQDPLCHPVMGDLVKTSNLLVRIKRRKRGRVDGAESSGGGGGGGGGDGDHVAVTKATAADCEVVGVVRGAYRFRGLADFQHLSHKHAVGGSRLGHKRARAGDESPPLDIAALTARTALDVAPPLFCGFDLPQLAVPTMAVESAAARYAALAVDKAPRGGGGSAAAGGAGSAGSTHDGAGGSGGGSRSGGGGAGTSASACVVDFKQLLKDGSSALPSPPPHHVPIVGLDASGRDGDDAAAEAIANASASSPEGTAVERLARLFAVRPIWTIEALQLRLRKDAAAAEAERQREAAAVASTAGQNEGKEGGASAVAAADVALAQHRTAPSFPLLPLSQLKQALPSVAYKFKNGPWRTAWVRFGYMPSQQPTARQYQVIDLRNQDSLKEGVPDNQVIASVDLHGHPVRKKMTLQWCDLMDRDVLWSIDEVPASAACTEKEGWLFKDVLALLKQLARRMTDAVLLRVGLARSNCNEDNIQKQEEEITQSKLAVSRARLRMH